MFGILQRLADFDKADLAVFRPDHLARAFLRAVFDAEVDRVHAALLGQLVDHRFRSERGIGGAGCAVGGGLGPVDHHVKTVDQEVGDVIRRDHAHRAGADRRTRKGAGFEGQPDLGRGDAPVFGGAHLYLDPRARGGAGGAQDFGTAHHHLDRNSGLTRQQQRDRLQVDGGLAAEPAANLGRNHAQVALRNSQ